MLTTRLMVVEAIPSPNMIIDSNSPIVGYYQRVGVTYESWEELTNLVWHFISETDETFLRIEEMWNPDSSQVIQRTLLNALGGPSAGIRKHCRPYLHLRWIFSLHGGFLRPALYSKEG